MERLTHRLKTGEVIMATECEGKYTKDEWICVLQERLAAYEDTGLAQEDVLSMKMDMAIINAMFQYTGVERMKELAKADREGRVVVLPRKVGDILYRIFKERTKCSSYGEQFEEYSCSGCDCECDSTIQLVIRPIQPNTLPELSRYIQEIGKTVFLTLEEAKEALEVMKNG